VLPTVTALTTTAVKGMRVRLVPEIELGELGARGDREFCVIDERDRMLNGKQIGELHLVQPAFYAAEDELALTFPDGTVASDRVGYGETIEIRFFSRRVPARVLEGPWAQALSEFAGRSLRLGKPEIGVDRGRRGAASLVSRASLQRLAEVAETESVDPRRFRMLIEIGGVSAHEEDSWVGRRVRPGGALVAMHGHVGRCLVTSRDPESGVIDLPTLDLLGGYRGDGQSTEPLPFGIYGEVLEPGTVRVGDPVMVD
jgi:hypothetical protein